MLQNEMPFLYFFIFNAELERPAGQPAVAPSNPLHCGEQVNSTSQRRNILQQKKKRFVVTHPKQDLLRTLMNYTAHLYRKYTKSDFMSCTKLHNIK